MSNPSTGTPLDPPPRSGTSNRIMTFDPARFRISTAVFGQPRVPPALAMPTPVRPEQRTKTITLSPNAQMGYLPSSSLRTPGHQTIRQPTLISRTPGPVMVRQPPPLALPGPPGQNIIQPVQRGYLISGQVVCPPVAVAGSSRPAVPTMRPEPVITINDSPPMVPRSQSAAGHNRYARTTEGLHQPDPVINSRKRKMTPEERHTLEQESLVSRAVM